MSFDLRNNSAVSKRAEQLKRWEDSETNRVSNQPKDPNRRRVKFSAGCVFLAACLSGDKEDILKLIESGVDIDTANVDGLTALHQVNSHFFFRFFFLSFYFVRELFVEVFSFKFNFFCHRSRSCRRDRSLPSDDLFDSPRLILHRVVVFLFVCYFFRLRFLLHLLLFSRSTRVIHSFQFACFVHYILIRLFL